MNPSDPSPLPPDWAAQTAQRQALADTARAMVAAGLNKGSAGNLSCRARLAGENGFYITPTGMMPRPIKPMCIGRLLRRGKEGKDGKGRPV